MQQRVAIARTLAVRPAVILMDEPFGALDAQTRSEMQQLLLQIWDETASTILFVTHDVEEAIYLADRIFIMSAHPGTIVEDVQVPFGRPRDRASKQRSEFHDLQQYVLGRLGAPGTGPGESEHLMGFGGGSSTGSACRMHPARGAQERNQLRQRGIQCTVQLDRAGAAPPPSRWSPVRPPAGLAGGLELMYLASSRNSPAFSAWSVLEIWGRKEAKRAKAFSAMLHSLPPEMRSATPGGRSLRRHPRQLLPAFGHLADFRSADGGTPGWPAAWLCPPALRASSSGNI